MRIYLKITPSQTVGMFIDQETPTEMRTWPPGRWPVLDAWVDAVMLHSITAPGEPVKRVSPVDKFWDDVVSVTFWWVKKERQPGAWGDLEEDYLIPVPVGTPGAILLVDGYIKAEATTEGRIQLDICGYCGYPNWDPVTNTSNRQGWDCGACGSN